MTLVRNPILRGFNPDPSIVRVGADYYIATSTFEWYPGVQIHHSRDLATWRLATRPLRRETQLDLRGVPDSCGVWAPDLSHADGRFHLIFTDVKRYGRTTVQGATGPSLRDFHNYWTWCDTIDGDWADPVHLNSSGFDPALFHDDDGRSWLLNMLWDHRPGQARFAGIVVQEIDLADGRLLGERQLIFEGTDLGFTEGPHLYKRDGWYHLLVAEGGTGRGHAVTMARSRSLFGPYQPHPDGPVLTARGDPDAPLARAGHGDLVETPKGETWMVHLCGRPLPGSDRCVLGRETAIQPMRWGEDGWLRTLGGTPAPLLEVDVPVQPIALPVATAERHAFDRPDLPAVFQWLRTPHPEDIFSLTERPGFLRLHGRESIGSQFTQALVARRQQAFRFSAACGLDYHPRNFQQSAGLVYYYNAAKFYCLHVTAERNGERIVQVLAVLPDEKGWDSSDGIRIGGGDVTLRIDVDHARVRFGFSLGDDERPRWFPQTFDATLLSDEATANGAPNFTGAFVGMFAHDLSGTRLPADFGHFDYTEHDVSGLRSI